MKTPAMANNAKDGGYSQHRGTPPPGSGKGSASHKALGSRHPGHQGSPTPAQIKNLVPDLSQLKPVNVVSCPGTNLTNVKQGDQGSML
jgi:hypothetical protein